MSTKQEGKSASTMRGVPLPANREDFTIMPTIAVMYPAADGDRFDLKYYMQSHIPLLRRLWGPLGLSDVRVMRGVPAPDGTPATYSVVALLTFASMDAFKAAADQHGAEIFADIPTFTSASPVLQFSEPVVQSGETVA
jgi:uncharacterized protein (TIGR02118 family)